VRIHACIHIGDLESAAGEYEYLKQDPW
jgi:hypothetical protein